MEMICWSVAWLAMLFLTFWVHVVCTRVRVLQLGSHHWSVVPASIVRVGKRVSVWLLLRITLDEVGSRRSGLGARW